VDPRWLWLYVLLCATAARPYCTCAGIASPQRKSCYAHCRVSSLRLRYVRMSSMQAHQHSSAPQGSLRCSLDLSGCVTIEDDVCTQQPTLFGM